MKTYRTAFVIGLMILVQQLDSIASEQMTNVTSDGGVNIKEDTGQGRFLASLYFPFFPQFYRGDLQAENSCNPETRQQQILEEANSTSAPVENSSCPFARSSGESDSTDEIWFAGA